MIRTAGKLRYEEPEALESQLKVVRTADEAKFVYCMNDQEGKQIIHDRFAKLRRDGVVNEAEFDDNKALISREGVRLGKRLLHNDGVPFHSVSQNEKGEVLINGVVIPDVARVQIKFGDAPRIKARFKDGGHRKGGSRN